MTKEELKQEALKHSEPKSIIDLIDEAYQAGQEAEREFIKKDMFEKVEEWYGRGTSMVADYFENLINTKE